MADESEVIKQENALRLELINEMRKLFTDFIAKHESFGSTEHLVLSLQVLAYQLGYFDAMCEAVGLESDLRQELAGTYADGGREAAEAALLARHGKGLGASPMKSDKNWKN